MVRLKIKNRFMAVVTFFVMTAVVILNGFDMISANAEDEQTWYTKYTYATGREEDYPLPAIPTYEYANTLSTYAMRAAVEDPREPSYDSAVVKIDRYYYNEDNRLTWRGYGTGFIIGDHEIMTAAHIVYRNGFIDDMVTVSFPNTSTETFTVETAHIPVNYTETESDSYYDYAIITVEEDLSNYGCYTLGMGTNSIKENNVPVHSLGYYAENTLMLSNGTIEQVNELNYKYYLYSNKGSSGGPIYTESVFGIPGTTSSTYQMKTYRTVISLMVCGDTEGGSYNTFGARIRPETLQFAYDNDEL